MEMIDKNAITIKGEFTLLSALIDFRFKMTFDSGNANPSAYEKLKASSLVEPSSPYAMFIDKHQFQFDERMLIALALCPDVQPKLLDIFFTKNSNLDKPFTEFGGIKGLKFSGFIPTVETFLFLCAGDSFQRRLELMLLFDRNHTLSKEQVLNIDVAENKEPFTTASVSINPQYLGLLTRGIIESPDFSMGFPAQLLETPLKWSDLILNGALNNQIDELVHWIENQNYLMNELDLLSKIKPGYKVLFHGPPGTGKTLTATLLGKRTQREVYRIDLSAIVSKFIGETEKNLSKVFDMAKNKSWILFFDEADALFGKRTTTGSSNDKYANQEVSYLLQRIESFGGTVILASNFKANIDTAFLRRFQSVIYFPKPNEQERLRLWENAFPKSIKIDQDISFQEIAEKYEVTGGNIINVIRYCALQLVMAKKEEVELKDVLNGIKREMIKEGQVVS